MFRVHTVLMSLLFLAAGGPALAQSFSVDLEVPRLNVAEYHRPYLALWIAREDDSVVANLAVLYDLELEDEEGEKWLKDLRQWWRRTGRGLDMPIDGLSGATRGPGKHTLQFTDKVLEMADGDYRLLVEASREVGGRELVEIPFTWPPSDKQLHRADGTEELGEVTLTLAP